MLADELVDERADVIATLVTRGWYRRIACGAGGNGGDRDDDGGRECDQDPLLQEA